MDLHIAIVDDRKEDRENLTECLGVFFDGQQDCSADVRCYQSAEDFLKEFQPDVFHIAFFDIMMDGMDGIELANKVREADHKLLIVFQTTSTEYAFDAFPVHPFDYLVKPCRQDALTRVMKEALRVIETGDPEIEVKVAWGSYSIPIRTISSVVSQGHNVMISLYEEGQTVASNESFKEITSRLADDPRFLQINRGVLINMDQVQVPGDQGMEMKNGDVFPIKVNGKAQILSAFSQYMISSINR